MRNSYQLLPGCGIHVSFMCQHGYGFSWAPGTATEPEQGLGLLSKDGGRGGAADDSAAIRGGRAGISGLLPVSSAQHAEVLRTAVLGGGARLICTGMPATPALPIAAAVSLPPSCRIARTPSAQVCKLADRF